MFHPVTSLVSLVECVSAHTITFVSVTKSHFSIEVSTNKRNVFFAIFCVLLDRSVHFSDVVVRISRVGEANTHQFDALAVDHDCVGDGTFVDVFSANYSLHPLLVLHDTMTHKTDDGGCDLFRRTATLSEFAINDRSATQACQEGNGPFLTQNWCKGALRPCSPTPSCASVCPREGQLVVKTHRPITDGSRTIGSSQRRDRQSPLHSDVSLLFLVHVVSNV